jgi:hypothetical protein
MQSVVCCQRYRKTKKSDTTPVAATADTPPGAPTPPKKKASAPPGSAADSTGDGAAAEVVSQPTPAVTPRSKAKSSNPAASSKSKSVSRQALLSFYNQHDPSKTAKVDAILVAYEGKDAALIEGLREKYGSSVELDSIMEEKHSEADEVLPFGETEHALEQVDTLRNYRENSEVLEGGDVMHC